MNPDLIRSLLETHEANSEENQRIVEHLGRSLVSEDIGEPPAPVVPVDPLDPGDKEDPPGVLPHPHIVSVPHVDRPTEYEYIVQGNKVRDVTVHGSSPTHETGSPIAFATRKGLIDRARGDRHGPVSIGIEGPATGVAFFGKGEYAADPNVPSFTLPDDEWMPIAVNLQGLTDDAEINHLGLHNESGEVVYLGLWDLGIRGGHDSFVIRQEAKVGFLMLDGCWWLQNHGFIGGEIHESGMHLGEGYDTLIWRRHEHKGIKLQDHSGYIKPGGKTIIQENNLLGGNRTGFQIRPHPASAYPASPRPSGEILVEDNFAHGHGWNHGSGPETYAGGGVISLYNSPDFVEVVRRNTITDAKYAAYMIGGQPPSNGNYTNARGFTHRQVDFYENIGENLRGDRPCCTLSDIELLRMFAGNQIQTHQGTFGMVFDSMTQANWGRPLNGKVELIGPAAREIALQVPYRFDRDSQTHVPLSEAELRDMAVL